MFEYTTNRLQWLMEQMRAGWRRDAPVIERPSYAGAGRTSAFEFLLRHERGCQVIAVQDCSEVRAFMQERGLSSIAI